MNSLALPNITVRYTDMDAARHPKRRWPALALLLVTFVAGFVVSDCAFARGTSGIQETQEKNSTRKSRIKPTRFSGRCGAAVQWRDSVEAAMTESASSGKPVFWYVPTIAGTFMDRKPVIDQYMLAGPFSWPAITELINENFVPVREVASGELQDKYDLQRYKFVEPGFVVLNPEGKVEFSIDQMTTLDPHWILGVIAGIAKVETPGLSQSDELSEAWSALRAGNFEFDLTRVNVDPSHAAEQELLSGMFAFRRGEHDQARSIWKSIGETHPEHPLAWKAAAEAENWGPFVRGFEVHQKLSVEAMAAGIKSRGSAAPSRIYDEDQIWQRCTNFLLGMQSGEGGWMDSDYDFGGSDSLPNVHVAVSSLCGMALLEALPRMPERREALLDAIHRAADYCSDASNMNYVDRDEILWANAYRVRFLARLVSLSDEERTRYDDALARAVADLESIQTKRGTWYHEYANPFVTATALTALKQAEAIGATIDRDKVTRGVASLANDRFANGAYPYYGLKEPRKPGEDSSGAGRIPGSAGRMPLCELALWQWGGSDDERLQAALTASFENHRHLAVAYKYDNHTSRMSYGGFFFWYDMRSRAEALSYMTAGTTRQEFAATHRNLVLDLPELDGCFVDSHELGRCYGTAMGLLTLAILDGIKK